MKNYLYRKKNNIQTRTYLKIISGITSVGGLMLLCYSFLPLISWQLYFSHAFASQNIASPIPHRLIITPSAISSLIAQGTHTFFSTVDYTNAENWFPGYKISSKKHHQPIESYSLSISRIGIQSATVSTIDNDLSKHLVNYQGTAIPGEVGNIVIFGHSTLPQLFNQKDYTTIFATLYTAHLGDTILITTPYIQYTYKIHSITVTEPTDTSVLTQDLTDSNLTLITCTPPGTTWKRLIVKARLEKI